MVVRRFATAPSKAPSPTPALFHQEDDDDDDYEEEEEEEDVSPSSSPTSSPTQHHHHQHPHHVDPYPRWHNIVAGAAAGAGARLLTAPLDLLKIRRQLYYNNPSKAAAAAAAEVAKNGVNTNNGGGIPGVFSSLKQIAKSEGGIRSLFRGNVAATYLWIGYAAVQFGLYARTSEYLSAFASTGNSTVGNHNSKGSLPSSSSAAAPAGASHHHHHRQHHPFLPFPFHNTQAPSVLKSALEGIASNPSAVAFCAGATAGVCATLATYPFDICRTTFAAVGLNSAGGAGGGGGGGSVGAAAVTNVIGTGRTMIGAGGSNNNNNMGKMMRPPKTVYEFVHSMYHVRGIRGFYAGSGPALVQIIPYMGINFALFDYFTRVLATSTTSAKSKQLKRVGDAGLAGVIAGGTSKLLVYPMDTVKKRLQAQAFMGVVSGGGGGGGTGGLAAAASTASSSSVGVFAGAGGEFVKYRGMMDCLVTIIREEGVPALYKGLVPTVMKSMVGTGCSFAFFTLTKNTLERIDDLWKHRLEERRR